MNCWLPTQLDTTELRLQAEQRETRRLPRSLDKARCIHLRCGRRIWRTACYASRIWLSLHSTPTLSPFLSSILGRPQNFN